MNMWSFDPVGGPWFTLGITVFLALVLLIGPAGRQLTRRRRMTLFTLRALTLLLLLIAMWRPTRVATETRKLPGSLVMMLDSSRSMQITDSLGDQSRWDALKSVISSSSDVLTELAESWDLKIYQFDEATKPLKSESLSDDLPEQPEGPQTAIGSALEDVLGQEAEQRIVAVLLLSDGAQRAFAPRDIPPQNVVRRLAIDEIPLYTFTFGKPALGLQKDLRVDDLLVNDVAFAETPITVSATIGADGYANQKFNVRLLWETPEGEMEVVDTRQIKIEKQKKRFNVPLTHTPMHPGEYKVSVQIESPEGELAISNNEQTTFVTVMKGGVNVLFLAGASRIGGHPGIEPRFIRAALSAHADLNVRYELLNYRKPDLDLRATLEESNYDVFLLSNVDITALNSPTWNAIARSVDRGAGLAMLGGFHSFGPGGFRNSPLAPVLPILMGRAERQNFGEPPRQDMHLPGQVKLLPLAIGNNFHPIVRIKDTAGKEIDWSKLPSLDGANRIDRGMLKPNAQVIAVSEGAGDWPLLVAGAWGSGRTLAFAADSTWHWQLEGFGEVHRKFWRQMVMWLARKDDTDGESVWVRLDGRRYQRGSRVEFAVGAQSNSREPLDDATFEVEVEQPNGTKVPLRVSKRKENMAGTFSDTDLPGDYRVVVTATNQGQVLGTSQARFTVPNLDMELDQPAAEPTLLASLAGMTSEAGGVGLAPEELPDLLERLKSRTKEFEEEIEKRQSLWDNWPMLISLVGMLGGEWYLRKRWGLV